MSYRYDFYIEDVSGESSTTEIREALAGLPGAQHIKLVQVSQQEAKATLYVNEALLPWVIEEAAMMTGIPTHHYSVRWIRAARSVPWKNAGSPVLPKETEGLDGDGVYDRPYRFTPPASVAQTLAWIRLLAQVRHGELVP